MEKSISQVVLNDEKNGKKIDWKDRKVQTLRLSQIYEEIDIRKAERIKNCGTELVFSRNGSNNLKLKRANFCKVRLCSMCSWRRALKNYAHLRRVVEAIESDRKREYSLLTLTVKNCEYEDLNKTIDALSQGINRFNGYKRYKDFVVGTYRALEITRNAKTDTFHAHYHILQAHNKKAYKKRYVTKADFVQMWKRAMRLDYDPIVDVRKIKVKDDSFVLREVTKYICKSNEYITDDNELSVKLVGILDKALANRRFNSWTGIFKYWHKQLDLDKDKEDLVHIEEKLDEDGLTKEEVYIWCDGYQNYIKTIK